MSTRAAFATLSLLGIVLCLATSSLRAANVHLSAVDRSLPRFTLQGHADESETDKPSLDAALPWTPERLAGQYWVINFWATWCPPCVEEIPAMNTAWEALEPAGFGMLAINAGEGAEAVDAFLQQVEVDFPVALGEAPTLSNWSVRGLPTTLVVNDTGRVVFEAIGPRDWDDPALLARLQALVSN